MADKKILIDFEIKGTTDELQTLRDLVKVQEELKSQIKNTANQGTKENEARKLQLKETQKSYRDLQKEIQTRNKVEKESLETLGGMRARLSQLNKELDKTKIGSKRFKEITAESKKLRDEIKGADEATGRFQGNVGNYKGAIIDAFQQMGINVHGFTGTIQKATGAIQMTTQATGGATKGFQLLKVAIASTGIGLLVVALASLVAAFRSSEEGQNKWNKVLSVTGAIVGNFIDLLAALGEKLIAAFENPKAALEAFGNLLRDQVVKRFEGFLKLIPSLATAVKQLFAGDFAAAAKTAADASGKILFGVDSITDSVKGATDAVVEFTEEQAREAQLAAEVADKRARADKLERDLLIERSKLEQQIAELRLKSRQEDQFTAEERRQALLDAQELEDGLLEKEIEALELRAEAQTLENSFARSTKENLDEEAKLIAAVNQQTTARLNQQRQTQRELNRINKEVERNNELIRKNREENTLLLDVTRELNETLANERQIRIESGAEIRDYFAELYMEELANVQNIREQTEKGYQARLEALQELKEAEIITEQEYNNRKLALNQSITDQSIEQLQNVAVEGSKIQQGLFVFEKLLAVKRAFLAITQGTAETAKVGFPQNIPLLIGFAAQVAGLISAITSVTAPKPPKFARGVIGLRGAGTETSDSITAKLSKGESVMTARATKVFAPVLADMERAVGNVPNYSPATKRFAGGLIAAPRTEFPQSYDRIIEQTLRAVGQIPVVVTEGDITTTQDKVRRINVTGDL